MADKCEGVPPILREKYYAQPTAFTPENLLREARRQKVLPDRPVPAVCLLDPDGDVERAVSKISLDAGRYFERLIGTNSAVPYLCRQRPALAND